MARSQKPEPTLRHEPIWSATLLLAVTASLLTWAAFPPLGLSLLAWLAPLAWARLITTKKLPGWRPYWVIWAVSAIMWGILLEGIGRAYWANYFGLVLLGGYLGFYQVLFVGLSRFAVHGWNLSVVIAAPTVWTGLELARGYLITGFSMALLGHTQVNVPSLIQIADLVGAYGVSFLVVLVGTCLSRSLPRRGVHWKPGFLLMGAGVSACVLVYGLNRMASLRQLPAQGSLKVALIQGTEDTILDSDIDAARQRAADTFNQYWRLTLDVCDEHDGIDLIVWPEGVFSGNVPQLVTKGVVAPPPGSDLDETEVREIIVRRKRMFDEKVRAVASAVNRASARGETDESRTHLLVGCDAVELSGEAEQTYNAALLIEPTGGITGRYDKIHRVLIGEYVPFGDRLPWLYELLPTGRGLTAGTHPVSFDVRDVKISPCICFEVTVPHLIRRQVRLLSQQGNRPDVLVNLTNDGWFWGSEILDLQLTCAVFRAIELRRPVLVAANTGLTAWIDSNGVVRSTLPRREEGAVVTEVATHLRTSFYESSGDLFAGLCLLICVALLLASGLVWWKSQGISR